MCSSGSLLPELLGKPDENSFGAPDVAEPIRIFVLDHFADELRAAVPEPGERIVDVLHGEHDAQVTESVHRGAAVIGDHRRREESGDLEPAVTVRRTHHGNLYAHVAQSSDAICPVSFDWGAPLELEPKFGEELNGGVDVFYHDADVVHTLDCHDVSLASNATYQPRRALRAVGCMRLFGVRLGSTARFISSSESFWPPQTPRKRFSIVSAREIMPAVVPCWLRPAVGITASRRPRPASPSRPS